LPDSAFRHELEADIEPFRGILCGLFFVAVGMAINVDNLLYSWPRILLAVVVVMLIKAAVLYILARLFRASHNDAVRIALLLPQAGEFAFVLFASASAVRALLAIGGPPSSPDRHRHHGADAVHGDARTLRAEAGGARGAGGGFRGAGGNVLVVGFGRFGQILAQVLLAKEVNATILDVSAERVRQAARFGFRIYFGDGTRRDVLRAAGAEQAAIICVCVDKPDVANRIVDLVMVEFPSAKVYVRSWDRGHTLELLGKGVDYELRETYESALAFGAATLRGIGISASEADDIVTDVRRRDADRLAVQLSGDAVAGVAATQPKEVTPEPLSPPARARQDVEREAAE
jgi:CPA2 family monovalent cation:H+ antiporter-2